MATASRARVHTRSFRNTTCPVTPRSCVDGTEIWRITPAGDEILYAARLNNQWGRF